MLKNINIALLLMIPIIARALPILSNGADYALIYVLKQVTADNAHLQNIVKNITLSELPEIEEIYTVLKGNGVDVSYYNKALQGLYSELSDNGMAICEMQTIKTNNSEFIFIQKFSDGFKYYDFLENRVYYFTEDDFVRKFRTVYTGRMLIIKVNSSSITGNAMLKDGNNPQKKIHVKINNAEYAPFKFYAYKKGKSLNIPTIVDLGVLASGGSSFNVSVPILNQSNKEVEVKSVSGACKCVSNILYPSSIPKNSFKDISFDFNPSIYEKNEIFKTWVNVQTGDPLLPGCSIVLTGIIDDEKTLIIDPSRIWAIVDAENLKKNEFIIELFSSTNVKNISIGKIEKSNEYIDVICLTKFRDIKYGKLVKVAEFKIKLYKILQNNTKLEGNFSVNIKCDDISKLYVIPYTFIFKKN